MVWEKVTNHQFTFLSDPSARVIHRYGLLHAKGSPGGDDIALRTTMFIDEHGRPRWRRVSTTVADIPTIPEILDRIRESYK
jgi:peroxiredoxin